MDKELTYEAIIVDFLEEQAAIKPANTDHIENQVIADRERHHYQLLSVGWEENKRFVHHCIFHFDIKDGKVWIQQNWTELKVADILVEKGVAKEDIVLGFQPPFARRYSGFAAA